jgi:DNA invertase Pin-like site-specific DNA recombinase
MTDQSDQNEPDMPLAYSYERFSTRGQMKGDSMRRQSAGAEAFAHKHGLRLVKSYHDFGVSAYRGKNKTEGALGDFIQQVKDGKVKKGSVLIVEALDRISREKVGEALPWFMDVLKTGVRIGIVRDDKILDENSVNDLIQLVGGLLSMAAANDESAKKSHRVRESWIGRREKAVKGAVCPSWLYLDPETNTYKANANRVKIVEEIFDLTIAGLGTYTISRMFNERKEPLWDNAVGKQVEKRKGWHPTTIYNILTNRAVLGFHQPGAVGEDGSKVKVGEEIAGYYPKVIDEDVWLRAQAARKKSTAGAKGKMLTNLLGDIAECSHCHSHMKIITSQIPKSRKDGGNVFRYLVCSNANKKLGCTETGRFNYDEVEAAILDHVSEYKLHEIFANLEEGSELKDVEKEIGSIAFQLGELEKRQTRMADELYRTGTDDPLLEIHRKNLREVVNEVRKSKERMDGLLEHKAELEAQRSHKTNAEAVITKVREDLENGSLTDDEKYKLRARLSLALRGFIDFVWFDMQSETFDVVIMNGAIMHRFKKSAPQGRARMRKIEYVGGANTLAMMGDHVVRESFTTLTLNPDAKGEDPDRVELFKLLNATSRR